MVEDLMTTYGSRLIIAVIGVGIGLLLLVLALYLIRRRNGPSPFLKGGKNRQPRLQVLDAAAVDARRRIVLIRRDNIEHLVMIGGPTDVVIESGIGAPRDGVVVLQNGAQPEQLAATSPEPRLQKPERQAQLTAPTVASDPVISASPNAAEPAPVREEKVTTAARPLDQSKPTASTQQETLRPNRAEPTIGANAAETKLQAETLDRRPAPEPEINRPTPVVSPVTEPPVAASSAPDIGPASDALDAARRRVFQQTQDKTPAINVTPKSPVTASATPSAVTASKAERGEPTTTGAGVAGLQSAKATNITSEFDKILEEEMANNLAAQRTEVVPISPAPAAPRRDPASARVTGATTEPSLQTEIARIFGEMSVTKDDRQS